MRVTEIAPPEAADLQDEMFVLVATSPEARRTARPDDPHANPGFAFVVKSISPAQAEATSQSRVGATPPGLPGGQGIWAEEGAAPAKTGGP